MQLYYPEKPAEMPDIQRKVSPILCGIGMENRIQNLKMDSGQWNDLDHQGVLMQLVLNCDRRLKLDSIRLVVCKVLPIAVPIEVAVERGRPQPNHPPSFHQTCDLHIICVCARFRHAVC